MSSTTTTFTTTTTSTTTTTLTTTTSFTTTSSSSTSSSTHSTSTTTTTAPNAGFCLFRNVTIPYNSRILKAVVEFTGYAPGDRIDADVQCHFENADDSSPPSDKADLDTRELTSGIPWKNIEEWKDNYPYQTPQLKDILQTVINRAGWVSGNNILFTAKNDGLDSYRLWSAIEHRGGLERARLKVSWVAPKKLDPPVITPVETFQLSAFDCEIHAYPTDASIYYTLDGSNPNDNDILYVGPFEISRSKTVKARAYKPYWTYSDIAEKSYSLYSAIPLEFGVESANDLNHYTYNLPLIANLVQGADFERYVGYRQGRHQDVHQRIVDVTVHHGATIDSAIFYLYLRDNTYYTTNLYVYALNADNGVQIETLSEYESLLTNLTSAYAAWGISPGESAGTFISVEIKNVIQEIIDRPGWESGNSISIFVRDGAPEVISFIQIEHLVEREILEISYV